MKPPDLSSSEDHGDLHSPWSYTWAVVVAVVQTPKFSEPSPDHDQLHGPWSLSRSAKMVVRKRRKGRATLVQERNKFPQVPALKSKDFSMEFVTRFRFSPSRSRLDRFPISSSAASVMSPHSSRTIVTLSFSFHYFSFSFAKLSCGMSQHF
uniref:Uncharacterized protein n=1 Tax=Solanum tuberosum TaxID=4113 RepID=M1DEG8_SOLTU